MATGDASRSGPPALKLGRPAAKTPALGMRVEDSTVAAAPEAGSDPEQLGQPAGLGCRARGEPSDGGPRESHKQCEFPCSRGPCAEGHALWRTGKKFLYCEPHKRIKEVLEEELYIKRDECHIKNPPAVALEGIWSIKRNFPVGGLKPGPPSRNTLLPQAKYYSRHGGLRR